MGGMRGLTAGSMHSPTVDNLTDEGVVGAAYDHKVVTRLATYMGEAKGDSIRAVVSVLVYTAASVSESTVFQAPEFATIELDLVRLKGKGNPLHIFVLVGDTELRDVLRDWWQQGRRIVSGG